MRRIACLLTLPLTAALLAGCSSSDGSGKSAATTPASSSASAVAVPSPVASASPMPVVSGEFGSKATITLPSEPPSGQFVVSTVSEGSGAVVSKNDWVTVNYTVKDWTSGKDLSSSYDDKGKPQLYQAGTGQLVPAFDQSVLGKKAGSRVLVVAPPAAGFGGQGSSALGVGKDDTVVFVLDVMKSTPPDATIPGDLVQPPATAPQVKDNGKAAPTITIPAGQQPPADLQQYVLVKGGGPEVQSGQTLLVQYTGVTWADGKQFDSSWNHGGAQALQVGAGSLIKGWDQGLVGKPVGSRVLLVVPPALGYGDQASGSIPANSTLVFEIDILDAV
ncbi:MULTISPECIES: FKBP-type peptidyl-prolyl cis-trans isomerase [Kitasatospora]|uniref:peptidylprolyl isomerase n=1 Tax=Kitasatospora setae (strain ATCC 33774 / DSM 43861 / JCM 3304 / KCC A-0304 / NBRC 14216 / KM-6054) TaxID=452652 RepID=E4N2P1_KITSK|nr:MULTISPECIES: FKBP-type peptidyl-prolyl cis-trans isomerase [Kitasatospora]BAJ32425.1 putative peptidyl-prolyl cis-trans isomerase FKBP-type [Kitasatospora setae KM-6054]